MEEQKGEMRPAADKGGGDQTQTSQVPPGGRSSASGLKPSSEKKTHELRQSITF